MAIKLEPEIVGVDKIAEAFGISERAVQKLVIEEGLPRIDRGAYDKIQCLIWYNAHLHQKICGCRGPCNGIDAKSRADTNARAERKDALKKILRLAPRLVGKKAGVIEELLTEAVEAAYEPVE